MPFTAQVLALVEYQMRVPGKFASDLGSEHNHILRRGKSVLEEQNDMLSCGEQHMLKDNTQSWCALPRRILKHAECEESVSLGVNQSRDAPSVF